mmetsp:Transcript_36495/g.97161  ORF Transcript_36495/g.97161 Transcript_36495/m.97161 type:complete len:252 (+) Transcript_36495:76-831(+)
MSLMHRLGHRTWCGRSKKTPRGWVGMDRLRGWTHGARLCGHLQCRSAASKLRHVGSSPRAHIPRGVPLCPSFPRRLTHQETLHNTPSNLAWNFLRRAACNRCRGGWILLRRVLVVWSAAWTRFAQLETQEDRVLPALAPLVLTQLLAPLLSGVILRMSMDMCSKVPLRPQAHCQSAARSLRCLSAIVTAENPQYHAIMGSCGQRGTRAAQSAPLLSTGGTRRTGTQRQSNCSMLSSACGTLKSSTSRPKSA